MRVRRIAAGSLTVLVSATLVSAQQAPPLQFKMIDVSQAIKRFQTTSVIRTPASPGKIDFSRIFPKISLAPFPPRNIQPQLPPAFKTPGTSNPLPVTSFPFLKPK